MPDVELQKTFYTNDGQYLKLLNDPFKNSPERPFLVRPGGKTLLDQTRNSKQMMSFGHPLLSAKIYC